MLPISIELVLTVIKQLDSEIIAYTNKALNSLEDMLLEDSMGFDPQERRYVRRLIGLLPVLIIAEPDDLVSFSSEFKLPDRGGEKRKEAFKDLLVKTMGYDDMRKNFLPIYFREIGIKACVYCNAQLTVSVERIKKTKRSTRVNVLSKFQVDHFLPSSEYPCFSISLFNFYPTCGSCNNCKNAGKVSFQLYEFQNSIRPSQFKFKLDEASITNYLLDRNPEDIIIEYQEPVAPPNYRLFNDVFSIKGVYDTQKDIAEELILKAVVYTDGYKEDLKREFPEIFNDASLSGRLFVGNYTNPEEVHKRPMSKFMQEIARQLGLI